MHKIFIVVSAFQGCISDVKAFLSRAEADRCLGKTRKELGIRKGQESICENSAELREVEI